MPRSMTDRVLEPFFAGFAEFYLADPFRLEHLSCRQTACRMRVEHRVDDVAAPRLRGNTMLADMRGVGGEVFQSYPMQ